MFEPLPIPFFLLCVAYVSAIAGSVLNVVAYRLPRMLFPEAFGLPETYRDTLSRSSCCPSCASPIRLRHNIPVLSWLMLRGRCVQCNVSISVRYPLVEGMVTILSLAIAWQHGQTLTTAAYLAVLWMLTACALIDWDTGFLPDALTQPLLWSGLLYALYAPDALLTIQDAMTGAIFGYLFPWTINRYYLWRSGVDGIAAGDFKLLAALGAWFGVMALPVVVMIAVTFQMLCKLAVPAKSTDGEIEGIAAGAMPLGPGLALGGAVMILLSGPLSMELLAIGLPA